MNELSPDCINEEPPFDLKTILRSTEFSWENYVDFQIRTDDPAQVLKDLTDAWKEYGKGETGKQYATMKLLSMITDYREKLSPVDAGILDLQVIQFLDIVYPEILQNNYPHLDYWKQQVVFFREKLDPVFQENVEIGRKNVEIKNVENKLNKLQIQWREEQLKYFWYNLDFFQKKSNIKKFLNKTLPEVYGHEIDPEHPNEYFWYYNLEQQEWNDYVYIYPSEKHNYWWHPVKEVDWNERYISIQPVQLYWKVYYFPFDGYTGWDINEEIQSLQNQISILRPSDSSYYKMHLSFHKKFLKYTIELQNLWVKSIKINYSDEIEEILASELNTKIVSSITLYTTEEYNHSDHFAIWLVKVDWLKFKSYPSFLYTPTTVTESTPTTTNEPQTTTESTPPVETNTPLEILTQAVGTSTIHFSTADYENLFTKDSNEKIQIDAYITKVKELLTQKPWSIKNITLIGHVAWDARNNASEDNLRTSRELSLQRAEAVKAYMQTQLPDITIITQWKWAEEALAAQAQEQDPKSDTFKRVDISVAFNK